eukprot:gene47957-63326_t
MRARVTRAAGALLGRFRYALGERPAVLPLPPPPPPARVYMQEQCGRSHAGAACGCA